MTTAIAWGTPYYVGGQPGTSPYTAGNAGSAVDVAFIYESFSLGLVGGLSDGVVTVEHTYAPAGGGGEILIDVFYLDAGVDYSPAYAVNTVAGNRDGIHKFTAIEGGVTLPTVLLLALTPDGNPSDDYYGAAAWYEQTIEPVAQFWTRFVNTREVI